MLVSALLLAAALSVDGFLAGTLYGMRRIVIPPASMAVLGLCSAAGIAISMLLGDMAATRLAPQTAQIAGGLLLAGIGLWRFLEAWSDYWRERLGKANLQSSPLMQMHLKSIGLMVQVLVDPAKADSDASGKIDAKEALTLGIALGLDAFAAGFAAAMLGFGFSMIPLVAVAAVVFLYAGTVTGEKLGAHFLKGRGLFLPGLFLMIMGLIHAL